MIKLIDNNTQKEQWDKISNHPMQSWDWGEVRAQHGVDVVRIAKYDKDTIDQVFQLTFHKVPFTPYTIGYLPRSVLFDRSVLQFIEQIAVSKKTIFIKYEPYAFKNKENDAHIEMLLSMGSMRKSPHGLFPNWTQVIDLQKTESELLAGCKQKTRYNIKLAKNKGVVVHEETTNKGFEQFIKLYFETCKRQHYHGHTRDYHEKLFNVLGGSIAHILIASYNNKPLCAYELFLFKDTLYYPYGGSSVSNRNFMASNLLMWEAIRFGLLHGAKQFDLWGSLPPGNISSHDPWAGFSRFKEGYNAQYVEFVGSFDIIIGPALYHMYNAAHILRKLFLKIA